MTFIVDMAAVLFPPFMALKAGHLTAKFAAESAERQRGLQSAYDLAMESWLKDFNDPLSTTEGQELLTFRMEQYEQDKLLRQASLQAGSQAVRRLPSGTGKRARNNSAPDDARKLLIEHPDWTAVNLITMGITKSTAYKVYNEVRKQ